MKPTLVTFSLAALAACASASPAGSPVTIDARPRVLPSYLSSGAQPLELFGSLANGQAGELITVQANECTFPGWQEVATTRSEAGGAWRLQSGAGSKTAFRARWKTSVSAAVTVQTRPAVDLTQLTRSLWQVGVRASRSLSGRKAYFQRFEPTRRWRTIKTFRLTTKNAVGPWTLARFKAFVPRGRQVRAVVPRSSAKPCWLAGYSLVIEKQ